MAGLESEDDFLAFWVEMRAQKRVDHVEGEGGKSVQQGLAGVKDNFRLSDRPKRSSLALCSALSCLLRRTIALKRTGLVPSVQV